MDQALKRVRSRINDERVHPGRILFQTWMQPFDISQNELARMLGVSARRINEIVNGRRAITADTAVRLAQALGMQAHYWLALQADYEIERAWRGEGRPQRPERRMPPFTRAEQLAKRSQARTSAFDDPDLRYHVHWPHRDEPNHKESFWPVPGSDEDGQDDLERGAPESNVPESDNVSNAPKSGCDRSATEGDEPDPEDSKRQERPGPEAARDES